MRNGVLMVAGGLIALVAGVLIYQGLVQRQQQQALLAEVRSQSESTRRELERLAAEQSAIRKTVTQTHDVVAAANDPGNVAMRNDFAGVSGSMRTAIAEYYLTTMKLPANNGEAGLSAPEQYRGAWLQTATVMPDGHVELLFAASAGRQGGRIRLVPDVTGAGGTGVRWRCETDDFASIAQALPGCDYKGVAPPAMQAAVKES